MRWLCGCVLLLSSCAGSATDDRAVTTAVDPPPGSTASTATGDPDAITPEGYELVAARATKPDGSTCQLCLWLAESQDQRSAGLMFVTDLGPGDGMAFVYPEPHSGAFWMKNTVIPLSIAFYDAPGAFLGGFDMAPCTSDPCLQYPTPDGFTIAIETTQGGLSELGLEPGSAFELLGTPCPLVPSP